MRPNQQKRHLLRSRYHSSGACMISLLIVIAALTACGGPQTPAVSPSPATPSAASPSPATPNVETATSAPGAAVPVLYFEYLHFDLEAYPPYPSQAVPLEYREHYWFDSEDARRFRFERTYRIRQEPPEEGRESYIIGTGSTGIRKECLFRDGKSTCNEQPTTNPHTFAEWLDGFTKANRELVEQIGKPEGLPGKYIHLGTETHPLWGEVQVFERPSVLRGSERYPNQPITETLKIDTTLFREVERTKISTVDGKQVIHLQRELVAWRNPDPAELPAQLFDPAAPLE